MSSETTVVAIGDSAMWGTGTAYRFKPPNLVHKQLNDGEPIPPVQLRARGGGIIGHPKTASTKNDLRGNVHSLVDYIGNQTGAFRIEVDNRLEKSETSWEGVGPKKESSNRPSTSSIVGGTAWDPADDDYRYTDCRYRPKGSKPTTANCPGSSGGLLGGGSYTQTDWSTTTAFDKLNDEAINRASLDADDINNLKWSVRRDIGDGFPTHLEQIDQFAGETTTRQPGETVTKHRLDIPWWDWNGQAGEYQPPGSERAITLYRDRDYPPIHATTPGQGADATITRYAGGGRSPADPDAIDPHPPAPEEVDIVLLNGGTNDVELFFMMNPYQRSYVSSMQRIENYCYDDTKELLAAARKRFPNALLVLVGYPFFLSEWSSYTKAREFFKKFSRNAPKGEEETTRDIIASVLKGSQGTKIIERVVDGAMVFHRAHQHYLRKAVADRSHEEVRQGHPGVMYVSRGFGSINAFEAPDTWAWAVGDDDLADRRKRLFELAGVTDVLNENASIGHPNRKGSVETAKAIVGRYRDRYGLSVGETATGLDRSGGGRPTSLKRAFRGYDLHPNSFNAADTGSVRHALSHRVVDSIQVKFYRGTKLKYANWFQRGVLQKGPHLAPDADVELDISPGRSGSGETFPLDYESDGEKFDTPQFDVHSKAAKRGSPRTRKLYRARRGSPPDVVMDRDDHPNDKHVVTEVNIDPMGGRKTSGAVGHNYGPDRSQKEDNVELRNKDPEIVWGSTGHGSSDDIPNSQAAYQDRNRWDDDRLRLPQLRTATLRVTDPSFWALRKVEFTVNGELTWTKTGLEKRFMKAARNHRSEITIDLFP